MNITVINVIETVKETKDAQDFSEEILIGWLQEAEATVIDRVLSRYVGFNAADYDISAMGTDTKLIVPKPYSRLYEYYLKAQIDYARDELQLYHNDLAQYEAELGDFWKFYNRTHERITSKIRV